MFKILGVLVDLYALYAAAIGAVCAKSGMGGKTVTRDQDPRYFWTVIVIYLGLSVALLTIF